MSDPLLKQSNDVFILYSVIDFLPIPPGNDEAHLPESAHMMRYSRFTDAYQFSQGADIFLTIQ